MLELCLYVPPKNDLEKKIKNRFDLMLKTGALNEVQNLQKKFVEPATHISANSIIGINEIGLFCKKKLVLKILKTECYKNPAIC